MRLGYYLVLLISLFTSIALGQTEKGKFYLGANTNSVFSAEKSSDDTKNPTYRVREVNSFQLSTKLGYFIKDDLVLGVGFSLSSSKDKQDSRELVYSTFLTKNLNNELKTTQITVFAKYYFLDSKFKPFTLVSFGFRKIKDIQSYRELEQFTDIEGNIAFNLPQMYYYSIEGTLKVLNLGAGVAYFVNDFLNLELGINYSNTFIGSKYSTDLKGYNTNFGFNLFF